MKDSYAKTVLYCRNWKKRTFYVTYTIIMLFLLPFVFHSFYSDGKSFIWLVDSTREHVVNLRYLGLYLRFIIRSLVEGNGLQIPLWDFSIGLGTDVLRTLSHYYLEPLNFLSVFVPSAYVEYLYTALIILRFYLLGIACSLFLFHFSKPNLYSLIGTLLYAFNGYTFFAGVRHPHYLSALIYLPLLLSGMENLFQGKSGRQLILFTFLSAWSSYYFLYMNAIAMAIYFVVRVRCCYSYYQWKNVLVTMGKMAYFFLLGCGMSSLIFLPSVMAFLTSVRSGMPTIGSDTLFSYPDNWFAKLYVYFITPSKAPGFWVHHGYMAIAYLSLILLFFQKKHFWLKVMFILLACILSIPLGGFIFTGFSTTNNRWSYICALFVSLVVTLMLPRMFSLDRHRLLTLFISVIIFGITILSTKSVRNLYSMAAWALLCLTFIVILMSGYWDRHTQGILWFRVGIFFCICANIIVFAQFTFSSSLGNYTSQFVKRGQLNKYMKASNDLTIHNQLNENIFMRVEKSLYDSPRLNGSMWWNYCGNTLVNGVVDQTVGNYFMEMENPALIQSGLYHGTDGRAISGLLQNVKYYVTSMGEDINPPYGYQLKKGYKRGENTDLIFENTNFLPFGYSYSNYMTHNEFEQLNTAQKEECMLQTVILDQEPEIPINKTAPNLQSMMLARNVVTSPGVKWNNGILDVTSDNASIILSFNSPPDSETYIRLNGLNLQDYSGNMWIKTESDGHVKAINVGSDRWTYTTFQRNFMINLGYSEDNRSTCAITFPNKGKFLLDDIEVYSIPCSEIPRYASRLREEPMKNVTLSTNRITGTVDFTENKILCLSAVFSDGWSLKIDGIPQNIQKANLMYTGIPMEKGHHEIELNYRTPYLNLGGIISFVSWVFFFLYIGAGKRCKNEA